MQDITSKYKVVNCVDEKNLEWNTELIVAMELEHVMGQAAQNLNDGETRHGSREAQAHEHEYLPRTEEVCLKNACMTDVHMTSPHES